MSDRRYTDEDLESALRDLGSHLAYPPVPDLLPLVRARLEERPAPPFWRIFWSPRLAFVPALATLVLLAAATVALQPLGATAAEALGLRGIAIFRAATPPAGSGAVLADARLVPSIEVASEAAGFRVLAPAALGRPDEVYLRTSPQGTQAFLVYGARPGIAASERSGIAVLVIEAQGSVEVPLLGKVLGPDTRTEQLTVGGGEGVWIEGAPHQVFFRAPSGEAVIDTVRLAGNVLLWERGTLLLRIEGEMPRDEALRIAASVR